jgi:hypothetical protein
VQQEVDDVLSFLLCTTKVALWLTLISAALLIPTYFTATSPLDCQYELRITAAYKDSAPWLVQVCGFIFALSLVGWIAAHYNRRNAQASGDMANVDDTGEIMVEVMMEVHDANEDISVGIDHHGVRYRFVPWSPTTTIEFERALEREVEGMLYMFA